MSATRSRLASPYRADAAASVRSECRSQAMTEAAARGGVASRRRWRGIDGPCRVRASPAAAAARPRSAAPGMAAAGNVTSEELGHPDVEGVTATGTRTTTTIPAGAIGNVQPIKVVAEQWFSADLQVLVLDEAQRSAHGDDDLPPDEHRPRRARSVAVHGAARLHGQGIRHPRSRPCSRMTSRAAFAFEHRGRRGAVHRRHRGCFFYGCA